MYVVFDNLNINNSHIDMHNIQVGFEYMQDPTITVRSERSVQFQGLNTLEIDRVLRTNVN